MQQLERPVLKQMLKKSAEMLIEKSEDLCAIDSKFGDGDHGITIKKIADKMQAAADAWDEASIYELFDDLGTAILGVNGGSAGPLWGTFIGGFALPLEDQTEPAAIDGPLWKKMMASALAELQDISTAKVGDKTMMDSLIPAVAAAQAASDDIQEILTAAAEAAAQGAKDSEQYVAKFGRAKSYKEETIGTPDAGAVSASILLAGFAAAVQEA